MNLREQVVNLRKELLRAACYHCWRDLAVLLSREFARRVGYVELELLR
jgi:hypothetical protein